MNINSTLQHLVRIARWQLRIARLGQISYLVCGLAVFTMLLTGHRLSSTIGQIVLLSLLAPAFIGLGICLWTVSSTGGRGNLIAAIDSIDDVRDLGSLLEAYGVDDLNAFSQTRRTPSEAVGAAIKRLLRQIDAGAECILDARQREQLRRLLFPVLNIHWKTFYDPNLVREILRALAAIGTQADAATIKRLMRATNISQDLREAARVCLTCIEERLALQQTNETLLRPTVPLVPADEMLRPASARMEATPEDAEQLLRARTEAEHT